MLLVLVIAQRLILLFQFGFKYMDSDQSIMWLALKNYASAQFHEPLFYGQPYNTMVEALFAVPLHWLGVPPHIALPMITTDLALLPFLLLSIVLLRSKQFNAACLVIALPLFLPIEYGLITTMPRGFVTGLFITGFMFLFLDRITSVWTALFFGFLGLLGFAVNPNSLVLTVPLALHLFLNNYRSVRFYLFGLAGVALAFVPYYFAQHFYAEHPNYALHTFKLGFSFDLLVGALGHLDDYLNFNSPVFWKTGFIWLVFLMLLALLQFKQGKKPEALVSLSVPVLVLLSLCANKTHDGLADSVYFAKSRMFLGLPLALGFCLSQIRWRENKIHPWIIVVAAGCSMILQLTQLREKITYYTDGFKNNIVSVQSVSDHRANCEQLEKICRELKVELVIVSRHWIENAINYGCPACTRDFPPTLLPGYERRTWRLLEDKNKVYRRVLVIDSVRDLQKDYALALPLEGSHFYYLIEDNRLPTMALLEKMKIPCREF